MISRVVSFLHRIIATWCLRPIVLSFQKTKSPGNNSSCEICWESLMRSCAVLWKWCFAPPASITEAQTRCEQSMPFSPLPSHPRIYFLQRYFFADMINTSGVTPEILSGNQEIKRFTARMKKMCGCVVFIIKKPQQSRKYGLSGSVGQTVPPEFFTFLMSYGSLPAKKIERV